MELIRFTDHDAAYNQALEEAFLEDGQGEYLLLWRNDPAVVCGQFQNLFQEVDVLSARKEGVDLVRRVSGGGTVYHDLGNINYSIIKAWPKNEVNFEPFLGPVIECLNEMGYAAEEIANAGIGVGGEKISGSAQRIEKGRILHHGTLLYDCDLKRLRALANGARNYYHSRGTASVPWPVKNLKGDSPVPVEEFYKKLAENLAKQFEAVPGRVPQELEEKAQALWKDKYRSFDWTFGKSPKFTFQSPLPQAETGYESLSFEARKARISAIEFTPKDPELEESLLGCPLDEKELSDKLKPHGKEMLISYFL